MKSHSLGYVTEKIIIFIFIIIIFIIIINNMLFTCLSQQRGFVTASNCNYFWRR